MQRRSARKSKDGSLGRGLEWVAAHPAAVVLLVSNLAVAIELLTHPQAVRVLLFAYWIELLVVGIYSVVKLVVVHPLGGALLAPLFGALYWGLLTGLLLLLAAITDFGSRHDPTHPLSMGELLVDLVRPTLWFILSHGYSFWRNFLVRGEYQRTTLERQMQKGLMRVSLTWFGLLPAALIVALFGLTTFVVVIVLSKVAFDLFSHLRSHASYGTAPSEDIPKRLRWRGVAGMASYCVFVALTAVVDRPLLGAVGRWGRQVDERRQARRMKRLRTSQEPACKFGDIRACKTLCAENDAAACSRLGWRYAKGQGVEKDMEKARGFLSDLAAEAMRAPAVDSAQRTSWESWD